MSESESKGSPFYVYILRLRNGRLYVGVTEDLETRMRDHARGRGARTTTLSGPVELLYSETHPNLLSARARERQVKHWSKAKKLALARGQLERLKTLSRCHQQHGKPEPL